MGASSPDPRGAQQTAYFVNDVLLTAEAGGPVTAITTNGQGAEPTIYWPRIA